MTNVIQILYLIASFASVLAMFPQIKQLIVSRQSKELSLSTWATWGCCQLVSFSYALSIQATAYIVVNIAWIIFYAVMVTLIVKYRQKPSINKQTLVLLEESVD